MDGVGPTAATEVIAVSSDVRLGATVPLAYISRTLVITRQVRRSGHLERVS